MLVSRSLLVTTLNDDRRPLTNLCTPPQRSVPLTLPFVSSSPLRDVSCPVSFPSSSHFAVAQLWAASTGHDRLGLTGSFLRPDVGSVFYVGDWCRVSWANPTGPGWSSVKIQLMSGIETPIMNVATDLDCSSSRSDSLAFRCPDVTN